MVIFNMSLPVRRESTQEAGNSDTTPPRTDRTRRHLRRKVGRKMRHRNYQKSQTVLKFRE